MDVIDDFLKQKENDCEHWIEVISTMVNSGDFDWADNTLEGIYEHIDFYKTITDKQITAISNIRNGARLKPTYYGYKKKRK